MSKFLDRVRETTAVVGTGQMELAGAASGFRTFVAGNGGSGSVFYFMVGDPSGADATKWEFGYGTLTDGSPDTLSRTLIDSSTGALINWVAGTKIVMSTPVASVFNGILTHFRGATAPAYARAGVVWVDTSGGATTTLLKIYDGSDWITIGTINETANTFSPFHAGQALTNVFAQLAAENTFTARQRWNKGADIASAATLVIGSDGNFFDVTGNTGPITAMTVPAGTFFMLHFDSTPTIVHHATNLNLPGGQNISVAAGDRLLAFAVAANQVEVITYIPAASSPGGGQTGDIKPWPGRTAPSGWLFMYGQNESRTTYANLYSLLCPVIGNFTVTVASPAVVTLNAHGLSDGDLVRLATTGALPTGLTVNTDYFVTNVTTNTLQLAATRGGASINTTGTQSGTHSAQFFNYGAGDGSTTFGIPDGRGCVLAGRDNMGGTAASRLTKTGTGNPSMWGEVLGYRGGSEKHQLTIAQLAAHSHGTFSSATTGAGSQGGNANSTTTGSTGGDEPHPNVQPTLMVNWIIKF